MVGFSQILIFVSLNSSPAQSRLHVKKNYCIAFLRVLASLRISMKEKTRKKTISIIFRLSAYVDSACWHTKKAKKKNFKKSSKTYFSKIFMNYQDRRERETRRGGGPGKFFFHVKSENIKSFHVMNIWKFGLFIEQDISDKK